MSLRQKAEDTLNSTSLSWTVEVPTLLSWKTVLAGEARLFDLVNKILFTIFSQVVQLVKFNHYLLIIFKHRFYVVFTGCNVRRNQQDPL